MMENFMGNLTTGGVLMVIGMGVVFFFLCILVISMGIMSKIVLWLNTIFPEAVPEVAKPKKIASSDDAAIAIAIAVAKTRV